MSNTVSRVEEFERITHSSVMGLDDHIRFNLTKLLSQRREVAKNWLNTKDERTQEELEKVYDYIELNIKQLLALK